MKATSKHKGTDGEDFAAVLHLVRGGGTRLLELPSQEILELGVIERIAGEQHPARPAPVLDPEVPPAHLGLNVLVLDEDPLHSGDG